LRDRGIPFAVASNSPRRFVDAALSSAALDDLFTVVITADDVDQAKPAPDLYLRALRGPRGRARAQRGL
jgi:beta-phosphoglucomutase-like phosphatase (HAD superfamily)